VVGTEGRASPPTKKPRTNIELLPAIRKLDEILKGAAKKKNKRVPFKAVYCEVNGEIIYLLHDEENDKFYKTLRDPQGRLHKQEEIPLRGKPIPTAQWGDQHTHIQLPRPKEYSLGEIGAPLDRTTVRQLTLEFSKDRRTPPTAPKEWDKKMLEIKQTPPDWATVADRYATRFLTLKDGYTQFKHITHRAIFTRNRTPGNHKKDQLCRLCHKTRENSTHLGQCRIIQMLFSRIFFILGF
jgi:hypothetical protein